MEAIPESAGMIWARMDGLAALIVVADGTMRLTGTWEWSRANLNAVAWMG